MCAVSFDQHHGAVPCCRGLARAPKILMARTGVALMLILQLGFEENRQGQ
jgi:hypothetical protein